MDLEPHAREEREHLAGAVERRRRDIEERWLERVCRDLSGRDISPTELRDALPDYLARIVSALRSPDPLSGSSAWREVAREHAVTRVRLGFDIDQLVHEFILLRREIERACTEEGLAPSSILSDLIEGAIAESVCSYVESRDYESRRVEAQHVGFLTHELRAPLSAAILAVTQVRRLLGSTSDAAQPLATLERSHRRMRSLIDTVLELSRLGARDVPARPTDVTVGELLEEALTGPRAVAAAKGVEIVIHGDPSEPVHADPTLSVAALQNLLDNAAKFTDRGTIDVAVETRDGSTAIHVRDNCSGLSPEELRTIFLPFRRGNRPSSGSGLGLAIARRAVESQGGEIHAESPDNGGCHFWITLPRAHH
jgi:signal transduction histidine kinase